ncbi:MAG: hypothetical protein IKE63_00210 [Bacilli bacterium]|nr:hypothetical protein [Bacilli bacterium]
MLEDIKKIQGINHNDFDDMINIWINAAKLDLKSIGIVDTLIDTPDDLIKTAIITYTLSQLDVDNANLYSNSYSLQKDVLRHIGEYNGNLEPFTPDVESA